MSPTNSEVKLLKDVRTFRRSSPGSILLSKYDQAWFREGSIVVLGPRVTMCFDHRDQNVRQIIGEGPELFIIECELEEDPWYLKSPLSTP
ncbi:hypothetical protein KW796_02000 [Candidatus Parcubacteria bacterium]|nr:hypothetical protein [Candidatus Parcubacteria bacterium]